MTTDKQKETTKDSNKNAQQKWQELPSQESAPVQPERRKRAKPGLKGEGNYFRIVVRPKGEFITFRYQDIGEKSHILRLAGKRNSGSWDTQTWLISKEDAHIESDTLVADTDDSKRLIESLGSLPTHVKGDIFEAKDRLNVPERKKPTEAQQRARLENIKKAQEVRRLNSAKKE